MVARGFGPSVVLVTALAVACARPAAELDLDGAPSRRLPSERRVEQLLLRAAAAIRDGDLDEAARLGAIFRGERLLVQIDPLPGEDAREIPTDGLDLRAASRWALEGWVPADDVLPLASSDPRIGFVRLAVRPVRDLGPAMSEGATAIWADGLHCRGLTGAGVHVAVLDEFGGFERSLEAGELASVAAPPPESEDAHGTAAAEIVSDVAPGIVLHLEDGSTQGTLFEFVESLPGRGIEVISHSTTIHGFSFGDGTGRLCEAVLAANAAGAVWVNSAGNGADGGFYLGRFTDADGDGWHEFADGEEVNRVESGWGESTAWLDWDDYPHSAQDFDMFLERWDGAQWVIVDESTLDQDGDAPPTEQLSFDTETAQHGLAIYRNPDTTYDGELRLFTSGLLARWQAERSVGDPGACPAAVAVGAVLWDQYPVAPRVSYSSRGPTSDGRTKPDVVGPTDVSTSMGWFGGTSASAPHVAGAVALTMEQYGLDPFEAVLRLESEALIEGAAPDAELGWGRVTLDASPLGWECEPAAQPRPCTSDCGTEGTQGCTPECTWSLSCDAGAEECNGLDDDCDGQSDEDFTCVFGETVPCETSCGSTGGYTCSVFCQWDTCVPPVETCNGRDDDCDGTADEGLDCEPSGCGCRAAGVTGGAGWWALLVAIAVSRITSRS
ncbi:MAG: S8 family serine peptidase [Deltaproteobacteria bacterium]|nr:S8 family serine peptidase [Deltaproteobacteria bacterium]